MRDCSLRVAALLINPSTVTGCSPLHPECLACSLMQQLMHAHALWPCFSYVQGRPDGKLAKAGKKVVMR